MISRVRGRRMRGNESSIPQHLVKILWTGARQKREPVIVRGRRWATYWLLDGVLDPTYSVRGQLDQSGASPREWAVGSRTRRNPSERGSNIHGADEGHQGRDPDRTPAQPMDQAAKDTAHGKGSTRALCTVRSSYLLVRVNMKPEQR